jgi:glutaconate CoA-transferase subunit B
MAQTYSPFELMAVVLARELKDGDVIMVGAAMPMVEAAVRLAQLTHGPNIELVLPPVRMNLAHLGAIPMPEFHADRRPMRWAESYWDTGHRFDRLKDWGNHVFFIGGIQVDRYGNTNLIGVGPDFNRLRFRGPGSIGSPTISTHVGRYYIVLNSHNSRIFVDSCDYISTFGWGAGGADARTRLGLPGGGPSLCVTPLCVMDFEENTKHLRLASVHPGVSEAEVRAQTGFPLPQRHPAAHTKPPTDEELLVLRTRVDLAGVLRQS